MSDSETPRGVLKTISKRNILEALTGSRSEEAPPVPSVAEQKIAKQVLEKKKAMESKLEVLTDRRDLITEKLIRMKESLREGVSIHLLSLHLETLRRCADEFDKVHVEMSALLPKEQRTVIRQEYAVFEDIHNELYVDLQTRIAQAQEAGRVNPVETCSKHVDALECHSFPVEGLGELILLNVIYKKLDKVTQEQWEMKVPKGEVPEYETFIEFLRERGRVLQRTNRSEQQQKGQPTVQTRQRDAVVGHKVPAHPRKSFIQTSTETCPCCQAEHSIYKCSKFQNMNFVERKSVAARVGLCYNCLKRNHRAIDCESDQGCKVQGCGRKHHSLLHPSEQTRSSFPVTLEDANESNRQEADGARATTMCAQNVRLETEKTAGATVNCRGLGGGTWRIHRQMSSIAGFGI
nr:uncharacterized protein LOC115262781 [Aedes albopictus]